jgi:hypothetical protein
VSQINVENYGPLLRKKRSTSENWFGLAENLVFQPKSIQISTSFSAFVEKKITSRGCWWVEGVKGYIP